MSNEGMIGQEDESRKGETAERNEDRKEGRRTNMTGENLK